MERMSGRGKTIFQIVLIQRTRDDQLYSVGDITKLYVKRSQDPLLYRRIWDAVADFGERNGLKTHFDNCQLDPNGQPVLDQNRNRICCDGRSRKWYGRTWKNHLFDSDKGGTAVFKDFLLCLQLILQQKQADQTSRLNAKHSIPLTLSEEDTTKTVPRPVAVPLQMPKTPPASWRRLRFPSLTKILAWAAALLMVMQLPLTLWTRPAGSPILQPETPHTDLARRELLAMSTTTIDHHSSPEHRAGTCTHHVYFYEIMPD